MQPTTGRLPLRNARLVWVLLIAVAVLAASIVAITVTLALAPRPAGALARLTVAYPGGSPDEIDQFVAHPLLRQLSVQDVKIVEIMSVSGEGQCTLYARTRSTDADGLVASCQRAIDAVLAHLPADAERPRVASLPPETPLPPVEVRQVPRLVVQFDPDRLAAYAISLHEARALLNASLPHDGQQVPNALADTILTRRDNVAIRLVDVAKVTVDTGPNYVVRHASAEAKKG